MFVTAAFSFAGTELVGLAASETPDPRKTMPAAVKGTFWRIVSSRHCESLGKSLKKIISQTIIYVTSLTIIGLLIPYNESRLLGGGGANASPFVIALDNARIKGLNRMFRFTLTAW